MDNLLSLFDRHRVCLNYYSIYCLFLLVFCSSNCDTVILVNQLYLLWNETFFLFCLLSKTLTLPIGYKKMGQCAVMK